MARHRLLRAAAGQETGVQDGLADESNGLSDITVLICGEALLESEANASVRGAIHDGFADLLSASRIMVAPLDSVATAIATIRPDLVLCVGSYLPETAYFGELARAAGEIGATTAFWATEDPYEKDASYRIEPHFDAIFTCDRWTQRFYHHPKVFHLPLAGCSRRHYVPVAPDGSAEQPIDVLFCGVAFANRREIMARLMPCFAGLRVSVIGPGWGGFGSGCSDLRIDKAELIRLYAQSKIVLNLGRSLSFENSRYQIAASTPGPRTFEAAMAGGMQFFLEDTLEIRDYFAEDEIPGFTGVLDFRCMLERYLGAPELRRATALRAQRRALEQHSYRGRARQMLDGLSRENLL